MVGMVMVVFQGLEDDGIPHLFSLLLPPASIDFTERVDTLMTEHVAGLFAG
jgi:hypothetical protein